MFHNIQFMANTNTNTKTKTGIREYEYKYKYLSHTDLLPVTLYLLPDKC